METPERATPTETKKSRIWNPALDLDEGPKNLKKEKLDCAPISIPQFTPFMQPFLNLFVENYIQSMQPFTWRIQQFQQANKKFQVNLKQQKQAVIPSQSNTEASTSNANNVNNSQIPNPLVASALGLPSQGIENSCAICGASFRLTTDLVAHMRSNHRMCRFKRKNEKL